MRELLERARLGILRALDQVPPADGLCTYSTWSITRTDRYDEVRVYKKIYRCREPWHHEGGHVAKLVDTVRP